ncbi:unnamed protein product [Hermetia illucens]|uniref:Secreted protein n=1 Tax=Hermetia illucens TaxID=343691 RepID=A0A7R8YR90_HERIL|nr:unnamed protein product [Hermetia illucens]
MIVFQVLTFLCLPVYVKLQSYNEFDKVNNRSSRSSSRLPVCVCIKLASSTVKQLPLQIRVADLSQAL